MDTDRSGATVSFLGLRNLSKQSVFHRLPAQPTTNKSQLYQYPDDTIQRNKSRVTPDLTPSQTSPRDASSHFEMLYNVQQRFSLERSIYHMLKQKEDTDLLRERSKLIKVDEFRQRNLQTE